MLLVHLIDIYSIVIVVSAVLSWFGLPHDHPLVKLSQMLTEPLYKPIRRMLPDLGGFDVSPLVVLLLLHLLRELVLSSL